jgi:hypothetical protein
MVKLIRKAIIKIAPGSIKETKQFHKNNKPIKIVMELIELLNKECLTIRDTKL